MIEIIKPGTKNQIECPKCGAVLAYQNEDIKSKDVYWSQLDVHTMSYIHCPQCHNEIQLK